MPFGKCKIVHLTENFCSFQRVLTFGEKNDIIMRIMLRFYGFGCVFEPKNAPKTHFHDSFACLSGRICI